MSYAGKASADLITPASRAVVRTASATAFEQCRAIHCNVGETIVVDFGEGATGVSLIVLAGVTYPYSIVKVTTGTGVVTLY